MRTTRLIAVLTGIAIVAIVVANAQAMYHPGLGRFLQRDPGPGTGGPMRLGTAGPGAGGGFAQRDPVGSQYADGMNLHQYVGSNPVRHLDPYGEEIQVIQGIYGLNATGTGISLLKKSHGLAVWFFAHDVRRGFQEIIGKCAKLYVKNAGRHTFHGTTLRQYRITYSQEKAGCRCDPCWQLLKAAIDNPAPVIQIRYLEDKTNAFAWFGGNPRNVLINPRVNVRLPERDRHGNYVYRRVPFSIVLWHEAIGHASLGLGHPRVPVNTRGGWDGVYVDPTIAEENRARDCTRRLRKRYGGFFGLFGRELGDRRPTYY